MLFARLIAGLIAGLLAWAAQPAVAAAAYFPISTTCHASAGADEEYLKLVAEPWRWDCDAQNFSIARPRAYLRIDLRAGSRQMPDTLVTRLTRFDAMQMMLIGADGRSATRDLTEADMTPATGDWLMSAALPKLAGPPEALILRIDGARHAGMLSDARLVTGGPASFGEIRHELLIAALCGMLSLPLLFNLAFYRILGERFLQWHALAAGMMLIHTLVTSGLINRFAVLSLDALSIISSVSVGGAMTAAACFSADFIEPGKIDALHRRLLRGVGLWVAPWTLFYLFAGGVLRPYAAPLYLASFLPLIALFVWIMTIAKLRGSRAVNYQIAAWTPVMATALVRIVSALGATDAPLEMLIAQHYAMGLEVSIVSLGIADRFLAIRIQRDGAQAQSLRLAELAEHDPLTGLLNRRGVEERFGELHAAGFRTMAVIDLDHFKQVNDQHGHTKGDEVLCAAARALAPDEDTLAMRMGGEEFLLLLRGRDGAARAERRRQAIALRIATDVAGLERVVTASMGLVEHSTGRAIKADFASLYSHCDRLLYEAKHAGRNRAMSEKLRSFAAAPKRGQAAG